MRVYRLCDAEGFQYLYPLREADHSLLKHYRGVPLRNTWHPVGVRVIHGDEASASLVRGDVLGLQTFSIAFSAKAVAALRDVLERNGELLPLACDEGDFYAYNVLRHIAALDREKSDVRQFPDGRIFGVITYAFHYDKLEGAEIFRLAEVPHLGIFVTDKFVEQVEAADLKGFDFRQVG